MAWVPSTGVRRGRAQEVHAISRSRAGRGGAHRRSGASHGEALGIVPPSSRQTASAHSSPTAIGTLAGLEIVCPQLAAGPPQSPPPLPAYPGFWVPQARLRASSLAALHAGGVLDSAMGCRTSPALRHVYMLREPPAILLDAGRSPPACIISLGVLEWSPP